MWRVVVAVLYLTFLLHSVNAKTALELRVKLNTGGPIRGQYMVSHKGRGIRAFKNIPYAEPPIGNLRLAEPVPKAPWTEELTLNSDLIMCPHIENMYTIGTYLGQEDCLYLNVYAPLNPKSKTLPVMLFFHGGGFMSGCGHESIYGPDFFLDEDVILVTTNYRLSTLGFFTTNTEEAPGNYGMKDQVMVMKWIRDNIAVFGGNPNAVTIFGESAGAASVGYHMLSSMSKGLFHRAIMQSGTPFDNWASRTPEQSLNMSMKFLEAVGCKPTGSPANYKAALACVRKVDVEVIAKTVSIHKEWDLNPLVAFTPSKEQGSKTPFLTTEDVEGSRNIGDVPLIIGLNRNEGAYGVAMIIRDPKVLADLHTRFEEVCGSFLYFLHNRSLAENYSDLKDFYFDGENFNWNRDYKQFVQLLMDNNFLVGFDEFIGRRIGVAPKTFAYLLNYQGRPSIVHPMWPNGDKNMGVSHCDDLFYLFPVAKNLFNYQFLDSNDQKMRKKLIKYWVNFATTGVPCPDWQPVTQYPMDYMQIGSCNPDCCDRANKLKSYMTQGLLEDNIKVQRKFLGMPIRKFGVESLKSSEEAL